MRITVIGAIGYLGSWDARGSVAGQIETKAATTERAPDPSETPREAAETPPPGVATLPGRPAGASRSSFGKSPRPASPAGMDLTDLA